MDAAGLGIGAASLLSLFTACLEIHDTIECGRRYGKDYEVLTTKIGIERVRLSVWGDTVGLPGLAAEGDSRAETGVEVDPRLHDARITKAVSDILHCMRQLFEDTGSLTRRYGLRPANSQSVAGDSGGGNALVTTFKRTYAQLQSSMSRNRRNTSLVATTRWAIKDRKRFLRFVEDLRGLNDSLSALFPDISEQAREAMVTEIRSSTDLDCLQIVEQAVMDLDGQEQLAEAASERIAQLSQHTATSVHDDESDTETAESASAHDGNIHAGNINVSRLARQLEKLEVVLRANLKGSLQLSIFNSSGPHYHGFLTWEGIENDELLAENDKEMEYVKHPYLAWSLMHETETLRSDQGQFSSQDSEASRKFEGKFPGTRTIEGYAADFSTWARENNPDNNTETILSLSGDVPNHAVLQLVKWLRELKLQRPLFTGQMDIAMGENVTKLLGPNRLRPAEGIGYDTRLEVIDLLSTLNRGDIFTDVRQSPSLGALALAGQGLANFLFQMIVAYELKLRLAQGGDIIILGNMSGRAVAAMEAAERWINGVRVEILDVKKETVEMQSLVHEQQVEGLIRFAERLAWKEVGEMREFVEDAYANLCAGILLNISLWDWLFGLMLPGSAFIFTIMSALVAATPSLRALGAPGYDGSGLVLEDRSYWRAKYVLGRVLGGMKRMMAANGWVGPCPVPVGASDGQRITKGWWLVHARNVSFALKEPIPFHVDVDDSGRASTRPHSLGGNSSQAEWVRTIGDQSKWVVPVGPRNTPDVVEFLALRLKKLGRKATSSKPEPQEGVGLALGADAAPSPAKPPAQTDGEGDEKEPLQRAILELSVNHEPVSFTLYNNPVFIAAPRCIDGPHAVHERDLPKLQHILRVGQLSGHIHNDNRVLIIDATGQGECELVARAWCAEYGQHAILKRGPGTCFACAVRAASAEGLGVGCVIWT